uniref:Uncharacterized protein n=1 Tax=Neobodo designis TaxID=312471 RepID=A0A7S1KY41_NEODS|mmetsp:Transcript_11007/g.34047  ORF Transcript_11007/g.34047 Transcript_11007/m.34047 type:complete len:144 (+) Transcript_11007:35-466(+)
MEVSRPPPPPDRGAAAARLRGVLQAARKNQHEVLVQKVVVAAVQEEAVHGRERAYVVAREASYRDRIVRLERNMRWIIYSRRFSELEDGSGSICFGAQVQIMPDVGPNSAAPPAANTTLPAAGRSASPIPASADAERKRCIVA